MTKKNFSLLEKIAFDEDESYAILRRLPFILFSFSFVFFLSFEFLLKLPIVPWIFFRFLIVPVIAFVFVFVFGAFYIQDIYELESPKEALDFMLSTFWGIVLPSWDISSSTDYEKLKSIRGPGYLKIAPGTIVIVENLKKPTDVFGAGKHKIKRFQYIRASFDLGEKERVLDRKDKKDERIKTVTKDALEVSLGVKYRFRFLPTRREDEGLEHFSKDPYPFSMRAAFDLAYKGNKKDTNDWENAVSGIISSTVKSYIKGEGLEKISWPKYIDKAPLDEIKSKLNSTDVREKLKQVGAELLWFDVGGFDFGKLEVRKYQRRKWLEEWDGVSDLITAQGDAEFLANEERGRAEGQVDLLRSVSRGLSEIREGSTNELDVDENLRKIVLARIVQVIEAMTSIYPDYDDENSEGKRMNTFDGEKDNE